MNADQITPLQSGRYSCGQCDHWFKNLKDLKIHRESKHENKQFPCPECPSVFGYATNLARHRRSVHSTKPVTSIFVAPLPLQLTIPTLYTPTASRKRESSPPNEGIAKKTKAYDQASTIKPLPVVTVLNPEASTVLPQSSTTAPVVTLSSTSVLESASVSRPTPSTTVISATSKRPSLDQSDQDMKKTKLSELSKDNVPVVAAQAGGSVNKKQFKCPECPRVFGYTRSLRRHRQTAHASPITIQQPSSSAATSHQIELSIKNVQSVSGDTDMAAPPPSTQDTKKTKLAELSKDNVPVVFSQAGGRVNKKQFKCCECPRVFNHASSLSRHKQTAHAKSVTGQQPSSSAVTSHQSELSIENVQSVSGDTGNIPAPPTRHVCLECGRVFKKRIYLKDHIAVKHHHIKLYECDKCESIFGYANNLKQHKCKAQGVSTSEAPPTNPSSPKPSSSKAPAPPSSPKPSSSKAPRSKKPRVVVEMDTLENLPTDVRQVYSDNWDAIHSHVIGGPRFSTFTFFHPPTEDYSPDFRSLLMPVFEKQTCRFKVNFSHHLILRHSETNTLRFFHASMNNASVLKTPVLINHQPDFESFLTTVHESDPLSFALLSRPDTKWVVESVPSTSFYFYHLTDHPIGQPPADIPASLTHNPFINTLQAEKQDGVRYTDNKCFFRALALSRGADIKALETPTGKLLNRWTRATESNFNGVTLQDLPALERLFGIKVDVFQFDAVTQALCPLVRSSVTFKKTLRLILFKDHFMYIKNINLATRSIVCPKCGKLWKTLSQMERHEKTCSGTHTKDVFSGGVYNPPQTIWEELEGHGVRGLPVDYVFPYRATFDYESFFSKEDLPVIKNSNPSTTYTAKHIPLSWSVASNVPNFMKPKCVVSTGDPQSLVNEMIVYLEKISAAAYKLLKSDFADIFQQLEEFNTPELIKRFESYLHQLPVIGFNSGRYDTNVIKPYLSKYYVDKKEQVVATQEAVEEEDDEKEEEEVEEPENGVAPKQPPAFKYIVKKNNNFMCLGTEKLKFVDIVNYIAPGFSYSKYLQAYEIREQKGIFCYEYIDDLEKLDEPDLPPPSAFSSMLRQTEISAEEYAECRRVWEANHMRTLRDFLKWYNNKDVVPFLAAVEKQVEFYRTSKVDMFKDAISVPGITLRYLFKSLERGVNFAVFSYKEKELHELLRKNITGGPSIIFHRDHEAGRTFIRKNPAKVVKSIQGYDANALYLHALMQPMPTDFTITRKAEDNFRPRKVSKYTIQNREWLSWLEHTNNLELQTQYNGKEMRFGKRRLPVDGWCSATRTAYQFHGCLFHGHPNCPLTRGKPADFFGKPLTKRFDETTKIREYLTGPEVNIRVIEIWECEWQALKKANPNIQQYLDATFVRQAPSYATSKTITEQMIIEAIKDNSLFGLVECDIEVPDSEKPKFAEMTPIFKNIEVDRKDIGDTMEKYAVEHKLLTSPRRTLIGSYKGERILLATPLLKWYLAKKLVVKKIHQVIEYQPKTCFKTFGEKVSDARRDGDRDPTQTIKSDTTKLLGNAAYGKTLTNKDKHVDVAYVDGAGTNKLINNPLFKKMVEVGKDVYEVESLRKKVTWDLPSQIGFFVYQYAKLRMLQFYYDFLVEFVDTADFELCEMDTDSLYLALSTSTLEEAVKPDRRTEFYTKYADWFPSVACATHRVDFIETLGATPITKTCPECRKSQMNDKRTPGLFKLEYQGLGMISLCSKTYICFGDYNKVSTKGLNKNLNKTEPQHFRKVIDTEQSGGGTNTGFRPLEGSVYTYQQYRNALSYFYIKRKVDADKVTTTPLAI
ncbi:hypothetical protein BsWGS_23071 [Bradybaena similaris]